MLLFIDGIGIGEEDRAANPFATAALPGLETLLGGKRLVRETFAETTIRTRTTFARGIDAGMGVPGRPQSGTGQTALLTGANASLRFGRHFGPWVPTALREFLARESLFRRAVELGASVAFANGYPHGQYDGSAAARRPGAFPYAAHAAGVLTRHERAIRTRSALPSSIITDRWRQYVDPAAPVVDPAEGGAILAEIAGAHDLTVFAHFDTDYVGHRGTMADAIAVLQRLDRFVGALLGHLPEDTLIVITSDHGNLEDVRAGHTTNPVPLIAAGVTAIERFDEVREIFDVAPVILELLADRAIGNSR